MNAWQKFLFRHSTPLAQEVVTSLVHEPKAWCNVRGYWLCNEALKADIWIANAAYALKLRVWPKEPGLPGEHMPPWADRMLIWSLVKERREPTPDQMERARFLEAMRSRRAA